MIARIGFLLALTQGGVNPHAAVVERFKDRVAEYVRQTAKIRAALPQLKPTDSRDAIVQRDVALQRLIQQYRPNAQQGEFFSPAITVEFRRLIGIAMDGKSEKRLLRSLSNAEPATGPVKVNDPYPAIPLQSMPPTLLANLPAIPSELDYRIVGHTLILRDVHANLVVDFIAKAIP